MNEVIEKFDAEDMLRSLTGFDEIAIQQKFKADVTSLSQTITARALVFVALRRNGMSDVEAFKSCMGMRLDEVEEWFLVAVTEGDIEGKASAPSGTRPSQTS